jgi:tetratricopeptide (TPR) repeat protein
MNATPNAIPDVPAAAQTRPYKPLLIGFLLVILLFAGTYLVAWIRAQSLTGRYLEEANASYEKGDYLEALAGYQEYDAETKRYVNRGGYAQVERIWVSRYAWPVPEGVEVARERIDEIVSQKMTIEDAEQFIQVNSGRDNPYLGLIYLRLGELYEADGDERSARDVYESIAELFPNNPSLIERAQEHLQRLKASSE